MAQQFGTRIPFLQERLYLHLLSLQPQQYTQHSTRVCYKARFSNK